MDDDAPDDGVDKGGRLARIEKAAQVVDKLRDVPVGRRPVDNVVRYGILHHDIIVLPELPGVLRALHSAVSHQVVDV